MNAIEIQGLTKRYGPITAVDGLDLTVRQGELFALLGVNGAGKTTTIKMLSCLTRPDSGDARLLGRSVVTDTAAVKNCIGVSPQETAVAPNLTARENLLLMCGVHGLPRQESLARVEELARTLGLEPVLARRAGKLSGGWQRRLSIAMALVARPEILFLDEPTLGLDVLARAELWDVIRALKGRITVILTTHYMEEAEALSDRVGHEGRPSPGPGHSGGAEGPDRLRKIRGRVHRHYKGGGEMKLQALCRRTTWEIVRDPLNLAFGLGFPLVLLLLLSAIQTNVPVDLFAIDRLTPGISVFGLAFIALFSATLVARDRESALLQRLYTAPLTAGDFIFGYVLPLAPMAAVQAAVCYLAAIPLGLTVSVRMIWAVLLDLPAALLFIGLGLLCGSVMNVKQVGGICGALLTNLTAWLSGTWFDLELVGGAFQRIAYALPFVHAVELDRAALSGDWASVMPHLWWVLAYAAAALAAAVLLFLRQMKRQ